MWIVSTKPLTDCHISLLLKCFTGRVGLCYSQKQTISFYDSTNCSTFSLIVSENLPLYLPSVSLAQHFGTMQNESITFSTWPPFRYWKAVIMPQLDHNFHTLNTLSSFKSCYSTSCSHILICQQHFYPVEFSTEPMIYAHGNGKGSMCEVKCVCICVHM